MHLARSVNNNITSHCIAIPPARWMRNVSTLSWVDGSHLVCRKGLNTTYTDTDYNVWRTQFASSAGSGSGSSTNAAVPEPTTPVLLMFVAIGWDGSRRFKLSMLG